MRPDTAGAVATKGLPLAVPVGRNVHFNLPAEASTAKRPPRFDEFPPMIVVPAITARAQSRKPGLTVNFSIGAVRSGAILGEVCASAIAPPSAITARVTARE